MVKELAPAFIGGPYYARYLPGERPKWHKVEYGDAYFLKEKWKRGFHENFLASGGNFFVRRNVFDHCHFDPSFGMTGTKMGVGEEVALQRNYRMKFPEEATFYDKDLWLWHIVAAPKMSIRYKLRRDFLSGKTHALEAKKGLRDLDISKRHALRVIGHSLRLPYALLVRDRARFPSWKNYVYEEYSLTTFRDIGRLFVGGIRNYRKSR